MTKSEQYFIQKELSYYEDGVRAGLSDLEKTKEIYEQFLYKEDYSNVNYYAVIINKKPEIMCSGSAQMILHDFNDKPILSLKDATDPNQNFQGVTLTIIDYKEDSGLILFSWTDKRSYIFDLIKSLNAYTDNQLTHAVIRFVFEYYESVAISPIWWNKLNNDQKSIIIERFHDSVRNRAHSSLKDDGLRVVDWKVISRETNILL